MDGLQVTLGELVGAVQDTARSNAEVVAVINHLFETGRATLRLRLREQPALKPRISPKGHHKGMTVPLERRA